MAIDLGIETPTLNVSDRTTSVHIYLDDNDVIRLEFTREIVRKNAQGKIVHREAIRTVERIQADIAQKSYTAGGVTRTGNQVLLLVNKMSDDERQADINTGL